MLLTIFGTVEGADIVTHEMTLDMDANQFNPYLLTVNGTGAIGVSVIVEEALEVQVVICDEANYAKVITEQDFSYFGLLTTNEGVLRVNPLEQDAILVFVNEYSVSLTVDVYIELNNVILHEQQIVTPTSNSNDTPDGGLFGIMFIAFVLAIIGVPAYVCNELLNRRRKKE